MNDVAQPIFTAAGKRLGLFDLFAAVRGGDSLELLRLHPHQRGPAVTALAVMMVALHRYAEIPLVTEGDWEREWLRQVGADALRLVAPEDEVGFFQPPLDPARNRSAMTLSDIDLTFTKLAHAAKPIAHGSAEDAVFALWGGTWSLSVSKYGTAGPDRAPPSFSPPTMARWRARSASSQRPTRGSIPR